MVNAGAIAVASLIKKESATSGVRNFVEKMQLAAGRKLKIDQAVLASESLTGNRNRVIVYLMLNFGISAGELSRPGGDGGNAGKIGNESLDVGAGLRLSIHQKTSWQSCSPVAYMTMRVNGPIGWAFRPRAGLGGGLLAVVCWQLGIGVYSPRLDKKGNCARGIMVCRELADRLGLHAFEFTNVGSSFVQSMF